MKNYDAFTPERKKYTIKIDFQAGDYYGSMSYSSHTHSRGYLLLTEFSPADLLESQWLKDSDVHFSHMNVVPRESDYAYEEHYAEITLDNREGNDCKVFCVTASEIAKMVVNMSIINVGEGE